MVHVRLADPGRVRLDGVLALLLGTDEQHAAVALADVSKVLGGLVQQVGRLLQIDDVDAVALAEDKSAHLGVPSPRLMTEMHSGLEQLAHGR